MIKLRKQLRQLRKFLIRTIARLTRADLLYTAYNEIGILNYENCDVSGEMYLITDVLRKRLSDTDKPIMFDVGANVGDITLILRKTFPEAEIWAFEPNPHAYRQLVNAVSHLNVKCLNVGMGKNQGTDQLYVPDTHDLFSCHATSYKGKIEEYDPDSELVTIDFRMETLDSFCNDHQVKAVDFLKIDTEGNELDILQGAEKMLSEGRIRIIQFEFGECDVYSRTFLKDFYELLPDYQFARLAPRRLIPLGKYSTSNEIFRFQNIVAFHRSS